MSDVLYLAIVTSLKEKILKSKLKPEDILNSETSLMNEYSESRMTIRKSLSLLSNEGYIYSVPDKGNFVCRPEVDIFQLNLTYSEAHITGGLSNISFGLPNRALINRTFLTLAVEAGMDSAVVNPDNVPLIESLKATELLLGKDRFCRKYTTGAKIEFIKK